MAKMNKPVARPAAPVAPKAASQVAAKTEVRNSPIPKVAAPARAAAPRAITHAAIAERAYYIWQKTGGSEFENWIRAERELRAGA